MVFPSKKEYQRLSYESDSESHEFLHSPTPSPTRFWYRSAFLVIILTTLLVSIASTSILAWKTIHLRGEIHSLEAQIQELNHHVHMTRSPYGIHMTEKPLRSNVQLTSFTPNNSQPPPYTPLANLRTYRLLIRQRDPC